MAVAVQPEPPSERQGIVSSNIHEELGETVRKLNMMLREATKVAERAMKLDDALRVDSSPSRPCRNPAPYMTHYGVIACAGCAMDPRPPKEGPDRVERLIEAASIVRRPHAFVDGPACGCEACDVNRRDAS